ncbi:MAG: hypothetical protein KF760_17980 [Candidatus Eremiobacteraeota bacterium]|nr:hypothetical protein [Candidatus Eremiobacteraeota bacterium]MCW5871216.1 hypothetical protein [Candidatus Eremiobacteraeota bacterium]
MNHFLVMLDKFAQRPSLIDARLRVFKLEANPDALENLPAPERLPAAQLPLPQPGQPAFGRQRRPSS